MDESEESGGRKKKGREKHGSRERKARHGDRVKSKSGSSHYSKHVTVSRGSSGMGTGSGGVSTLRKMEEKVEPKRSKGLGDPKDEDSMYPGLDEPEDARKLKHQTSGHMCGGNASMDHLKTLNRLTGHVDFTKEVKGERDFITYLKNERNFISALEGACDKKVTLYTMVSLFATKANIWGHTIERLQKKKNHFTSFRMFLREFRERQWPNLKQQTMSEARECVQKGNHESIECYAEKFETLYTMAKLDPDDHVEQFIAGLYNPEIRNAARLAYFQDEERTLESVRNYVSSISAMDEVGKKLDAERAAKARRGGNNSVAAATTQQKAPAQRAAPSKAKMPMEKKGGYVGNRPQPKTQKASSSGPSTSAAASTSTYASSKARELRKKMDDLRMKGCYGCLSHDHQYREGFRDCANMCPFCKMEFRQGGPRHYAIDCRKLPSTRSEIIDTVRNVKRKETKKR